MKKALCILAVSLCFFQLWGGPAYAGSLNENESELVEIITGTYEYEGVTYKVKDLYIDMAIDYLMQDSIDLTNEQKQAAIQKMFSSVAQGISEGYLEVVKDAENDGEKPGVAGGQQGIPGVTEAAGHSAESGAGSAGSETPDGAAQGGNDAKPGIGTAGAGETDAEKAESEKAQTEEAVKSPVILALESITQEEMQQKLQQEYENEELQLFRASPVAGHPDYPWKVAWGVCIGLFIGTVGCFLAVLEAKLFAERVEKKRRGS